MTPQVLKNSFLAYICNEISTHKGFRKEWNQETCVWSLKCTTHVHNPSSLCKRHSPRGPLWSGSCHPTFLGTYTWSCSYCVDIADISSALCLCSGLTPSFLFSVRRSPWSLCFNCLISESIPWASYLSLNLCSRVTLFSTWFLVSWAPILKDIFYLLKLAWCLTHNCLLIPLPQYRAVTLKCLFSKE